MALVVQSKVKEFLKSQDINTGGDFLEALDKHLERELSLAAQRAKANGRKTARAYDLSNPQL